jgi:CHAT domain-containing protein/Tfp pilus assembly protein PilF
MQHCLIPRFLLPTLTVLVIILPLMEPAEWVRAAPKLQADPAAQCAEGVWHFTKDRVAQARPLLEAGFAGWKQTHFVDPFLGFCALDVGQLREEAGNLNGALEGYLVALDFFKQNGDKAFEEAVLQRIGKVYHILGRYVDALDYFQQALMIDRVVLHDRRGESDALHNIGAVYDDQGRYAEALDSYQQALLITQELGDREGQGVTLNNIGMVYHHQGRYTEALDYYQRTLEIVEKVGSLTEQATTLNNIGAIYRDQGDYIKALDYYQRALQIQRRTDDTLGLGNTLRNTGAVYDDLGKYAEAIKYYQEALRLFRGVGNQDSIAQVLNNIGLNYHQRGHYTEALDYYQQALILLWAVGNRVGEGKILNNIGAVYHDQGQYTEALDYYQQAMNILEEVRAIAGSELGRANFIAQYASLYDRAVLLYHQLGQDDLAFRTSEHGRARAFLDSLATGYIQLSDQDATTLLEHEQETYATYQAMLEALARVRAATPPDPTLVADLEKQLTTAEQQHAEALAAIEQRDKQLAALVPSRTKSVLDLPAVQQLLDSQTTLISFYVLVDQTLASLITHDSFRTVALDVSLQDLIIQIRALRAFPTLSEAHPASAVQLYGWLVAPLKSYLTTSHLTIVPHRVLHYLPFAALTDGARYLVDDYTLTILPNASSLSFIQTNSSSKSASLLILGNPTTNDPLLRPLAFAEREAQSIAALYGVEPLFGAMATKRTLQERSAQSGIVHLAAHGGYNYASPLASVIALAPDGADDGRLEVREVYSLNLHATDLVVLSACETQLGELSAGDEVVGLTRAFFFAGTPSVIATLWSVDDEATALLMERFYTHLRAGMGKAAALRQAQFDVRTKYPNPYYWSGFVLSGDGGPLNASLRPRMPPWVLALTGAGLLICWVGCIYVRRRQVSTGKIVGYRSNQPVYVMAPRFSASVRRLALWGVLGIPALAAVAAVVGWFFGLW